MAPTEPVRSSADAQEQGQASTWRDNRYMDGRFDKGWDMSVEMIAAILVWGGIGWLVDRWLGTAPWGMVVGILVGNVAGIYLVSVRASADEQHHASRAARTPPGVEPTEGSERGTG